MTASGIIDNVLRGEQMISEKLHDKVYYYKNVVSDPKNLVKLIEETESEKYSKFITPWEEWSACSGEMYVYGNHKRIRMLKIDEILQKCPEDILEDSKYIFSEIFDGFKNVCQDYAEKVNEESKLILMTDTAIKRYEAGTFMGSHFDQQEGDKRLKYSLVMYLNDDYEGGEISFSIRDGVLTSTDYAASEDINDPRNEERITFSIKPEAGSVIIFPSEPPYSHTAHLVKSGLKYMVPSFWLNKGSFVDGVFVPE
jgi:hypothetical protein